MNGAGARSNAPLAFVAGSVFSGGLVYYLASGQAGDATAQGKPVEFNTQYGSPEEFKKAIEELRVLFAGDEDAVTTDVEDLEDHGFSENDYHPGELTS